MYYLGIDPGQKGALAFLRKDNSEIEYFPIPLNARKEIDSIGFAKIIDNFKVIKCCLEECQYFGLNKGSGKPRMSGKSLYTFGKMNGSIISILELLQISFELIKPQKWKKEFNLIGKNKKDSVITANRMFPKLDLGKSKDGEAEAILIAVYASRKLT